LEIEYYLVGEIKSVCNSGGSVLVKSFSDAPGRFLKARRVFADFFGSMKELFVEDSDDSGSLIEVKFRNFDSENDSQFLVGKSLYIPGNEATLPSENSFFVHDLVGSDVYRNDSLFGKIEDVMQLPANDVYVITKTDGKEILIPAVFDFIEGFDPKEKKLILKPGDSEFYDDED